MRRAHPTSSSTSPKRVRFQFSDTMEPMELGDDIDDELYSRQRYVYGDSAMRRMAAASVFLSGLSGLGVEIAKNVCLAGVKQLKLHDPTPCSVKDLGSQFYVSESDVKQGKPRAEACFDALSALNPHTTISLCKERVLSEIPEKEYEVLLEGVKCVIVVDCPLETQIVLNQWCRAHEIAFLATETRGVFCWVFSDCGDHHEVTDADGQVLPPVMLASVSKEEEAQCQTMGMKVRHGMEDGDVVELSEIVGPDGDHPLNGTRHTIKVMTPFKFSIGDTREMPPYVRGGIATHIKMAKTHDYLSLEKSLEQPEIAGADLGKEMKGLPMLVALEALHKYRAEHGQWPGVWNSKDADQLWALAQDIGKQRDRPVDEAWTRLLAHTCQGELQPLSAFLGGMVAQECLKALSGKFLPLRQWLMLDGVEVVPTEQDPSLFQPKQDRQDALRICVGDPLVQQIGNQRLFMVGAGAIGCEMLKNFAMLGLGCGDVIEKSNLNRQFLFRPEDIRTPKSTTAIREAIAMNPSMHGEGWLHRVGEETESIFTDDYFRSTNLCVNALDNLAARLYMDGRCVSATRPLLESGTMGTMGHVQVIVPHETESYGSQRDPPPKEIPFCTLKSFPNELNHTIEWARDKFENLLSNKPAAARKYVQEGAQPETMRQKVSELRHVAKFLAHRPRNLKDCIEFARIKVTKYFDYKMQQLLLSFPLDMALEDGSPFWSLPKRPPQPVVFDPMSKQHAQFIQACALIWADIWGLEPPKGEKAFMEQVIEISSRAPVPAFVPKVRQVETDEEVAKEKVVELPEDGETLDEELTRLGKKIDVILSEPGMMEIAKGLRPAQFEKDDDANHHIDFIAAAANLRARAYGIKEGSRLEIKRVAGKIIPAIATTTSCVSGLVGLEIIKVVMGHPREHYRNAFMNLALPYFALSEPAAPLKTRIADNVYTTLWDRWEIRDEGRTLKAFLKSLRKKYPLKATAVFHEAMMIFVPLYPAHKKRLKQPMTKLLKNVERGALYVDLIVSFENKSGQEIDDAPSVRYYLHWDEE